MASSRLHGVARVLAGAFSAAALFWLSRLFHRRRQAAGTALPSKPLQAAPAPVLYSPVAEEEDEEEPMDFDERLKQESHLLLEAADTVRLILRTEVFRFLPHVHVAEKQLNAIANKLDEVSDLLSPHNMFWRFGRDQPMQQLLETPLLKLAASTEVLVPVTAGLTEELGEGLVARFLVSGTDASKSRYREFASGILDAVQRELLMMRLEWLFHSMWDLPLTWGDGLDDMTMGGHKAAWGVAIKPAYG
mmetsp:Transcript_35866/g.80241  ORF Transcript_35866/g.80241 Transcript_35866/m.80241 type:complete len:247 (+) Transcript_35866:49-789(+)